MKCFTFSGGRVSNGIELSVRNKEVVFESMDVDRFYQINTEWRNVNVSTWLASEMTPYVRQTKNKGSEFVLMSPSKDAAGKITNGYRTYDRTFKDGTKVTLGYKSLESRGALLRLLLPQNTKVTVLTVAEDMDLLDHPGIHMISPSTTAKDILLMVNNNVSIRITRSGPAKWYERYVQIKEGEAVLSNVDPLAKVDE